MGKLPAIARIFALTLVVLCATLFASADPSVPPYVIIVHPGNPTTTVSRRFLEDAFLKKTTAWPSDDVIRPVDLPPNSPVRRQFTDEVLHRSVAEVKSYWQQRIFSGHDVPPPELDGDEDIVKYVLKYRGAIGYVSGSAKLGGSKVVTVR